MPHVTGIFIYPVKSCRGHAMPSVGIDDHGLVGDRRFVVCNPEGQFFTQRQLPRMALIETEQNSNALTLASPGWDFVSVYYDATSGNGSAGAQNAANIRVTVWKDTMTGVDCGDEVAEWLTRFLSTPARLVRIGPDYSRPVRPGKNPAPAGEHQVSFADAYPFLLTNEASLDELNDRLAEAGESRVPMDRFRPNIVVKGADRFAEDAWVDMNIGGIPFRNVKPCARCIVTTTDQKTGERGKEPLRTLTTFRRDPDDSSNINFGINLVHEAKRGRLHVGDKVTFE